LEQPDWLAQARAHAREQSRDRLQAKIVEAEEALTQLRFELAGLGED
jgi:ribosomal protein L29